MDKLRKCTEIKLDHYRVNSTQGCSVAESASPWSGSSESSEVAGMTPRECWSLLRVKWLDLHCAWRAHDWFYRRTDANRRYCRRCGRCERAAINTSDWQQEGR
jgi:hypothetical protein